MPRIRSIKPETPEDEALGACTRDARLTFILLWTQADDQGRFRASPALVRAQLFPYDDDITAKDVGRWLSELAEKGRIRLYEADGQRYGHVTNWTKHQRIDNAGKSTFPPPPDTPDDPTADTLGGSPQVSADLGDSLLDVEGRGKDVEGECEGDAAAPPPAKARKRATPIPSDFAITAEMRAWARTEVPHVEVVRETRQFIDHANANGKSQKDWVATWRTWMRNAEKWLPDNAKNARASPVAIADEVPTCPDCGVGPTRTCARRRNDCTWATPARRPASPARNDDSELRILRAAP